MLLKTSDWKKIASTNVALEAGVHMVRIKGENTGGPALSYDPECSFWRVSLLDTKCRTLCTKSRTKSGAFPEKQIAIPGGRQFIVDLGIRTCQILHDQNVSMGDGNYGSLTSVTVYAPQGMNVSAQDQSDTDLNLLAAVKEDAALISGKDIKVKLAPSSADKMAGDYAPLPQRKTGMPPNETEYSGSGKVD